LNSSRLLIVRLGSLGDVIHAVPAAAAIRRAYPEAGIDWLVDVRHRDLLDLVEGLNNRIAIDGTSVKSIAAKVQELRAQKYDVALDLQGLLKSAVLARLSGARRVIGFPSSLLREPAARWMYTEEAGVPARHVIDKNLSLLQAIGVRVPDVVFPLADRRPEIAAAARQKLGIGHGDPFALINPGAAWPNKRWPPVYFAEVARALAARHNLRSLVLWGPGEEEIAQTVVTASDGAAAISPGTTIADLVSLTKAAAIVISGDTGPMHVAAAVGTPIVGIFGPTDPARNGPWSEDDLAISRYEACGCRYQRQCRAASWCLLDISPRQVMDLIDTRLARLRLHV
jgi:lipopolysaccharide heptosyltransferase I